MSVDITKMVVALAAIAGVVVLAAIDNLASGAALGLIGTVVGYVLGNGRSVSKGETAGVMLSPKPEEGQ